MTILVLTCPGFECQNYTFILCLKIKPILSLSLTDTNVWPLNILSISGRSIRYLICLMIDNDTGFTRSLTWPVMGHHIL